MQKIIYKPLKYLQYLKQTKYGLLCKSALMGIYRRNLIIKHKTIRKMQDPIKKKYSTN